MTTTVDFLGFTVKKGSIAPSGRKVSAFSECPRPKNVDDVKRFVGSCGYYRRLIPNFSPRIRPLQKLSTARPKHFAWGPEHEAAVEDMRKVMSEAPVCRLFDPDLTTIVRTDASATGYGGVLEQVSPSGVPHAVEYLSRSFDKTQQRYSTIEREGHALIYALKYWFHFLVGKKFIIECDHRPLQFIRSKRDLSGKLGRWCLYLEQFDYEWRYVTGKQMQEGVSDFLSRVEVSPVEFEFSHEDRELSQLSAKAGYSVNNGVLYFDHPKRGKLIVPPGARREGILRELHDHPMAGHQGSRRTMDRVQSRFFWPGLTKFVKRYVKSCHTCAVSKDSVVSPTAPMQSVEISALDAWSKICIDFMGPLPVSSSGNKFLIVVQEYVTRWVEAFPVSETSAETVQKVLMDEVFSRFGVCIEMVHDNGTQLNCRSMKKFCQEMGIRQCFTSVYHPQSDMAERMMRTLQNSLRCYVNESRTNWDEVLPNCLLSIRTAVNVTTGFSPAEALMGVNPRLPIDNRVSRMEETEKMSTADKMERMKVIREKIKESARKKQEAQRNAYDSRKKVKLSNSMWGNSFIGKRGLLRN